MVTPTMVSSRIGKMILEVRKRKLTYLSESRLKVLSERCLSNEEHHLPGVIIEAGCALGGSSALLCASKAPTRQLRVYDVFAMIPPPSDKDGEDVHERYEIIKSGNSKGIGGDRYYGYTENLLDRVKTTFSELGYPIESNNVVLIKGMLQETLVVDEPVSLAHIDVDWYDPVKVCLHRIYPHLSGGGTLVIDDYQDWSGCRTAVDEYFRDLPPGSYSFDVSSGSLLITKVKRPQ